jgi:hypothetical protein
MSFVSKKALKSCKKTYDLQQPQKILSRGTEIKRKFQTSEQTNWICGSYKERKKKVYLQGLGLWQNLTYKTFSYNSFCFHFQPYCLSKQNVVCKKVSLLPQSLQHKTHTAEIPRTHDEFGQ